MERGSIAFPFYKIAKKRGKYGEKGKENINLFSFVLTKQGEMYYNKMGKAISLNEKIYFGG